MKPYAGLTPKETSKLQNKNLPREAVIYVLHLKSGDYIGSTFTLEQRIGCHKASMLHKNTLNYRARPAMYEEMQEGFTVEILQVMPKATKDQLVKEEQKAIYELRPKWNNVKNAGKDPEIWS